MKSTNVQLTYAVTNLTWAASTMDYSFLAARLSFTFIYTCIFFSWQINSAADANHDILFCGFGVIMWYLKSIWYVTVCICCTLSSSFCRSHVVVGNL